ncbi:MAG: hypothetical protein HRU19_23275 [Pseudobacteriovorax sp.]|nr:hypothetical protein [Pseudobacteriovorax sp.]
MKILNALILVLIATSLPYSGYSRDTGVEDFAAFNHVVEHIEENVYVLRWTTVTAQYESRCALDVENLTIVKPNQSDIDATIQFSTYLPSDRLCIYSNFHARSVGIFFSPIDSGDVFNWSVINQQYEYAPGRWAPLYGIPVGSYNYTINGVGSGNRIIVID